MERKWELEQWPRRQFGWPRSTGQPWQSKSEGGARRSPIERVPLEVLGGAYTLKGKEVHAPQEGDGVSSQDMAATMDEIAIEEMQLDLDAEEQQYKEWLGGRLQTRVDSWKTLGFGTLVEKGVLPDWIDGTPIEYMDATRRERYSGHMHTLMLNAILEELAKGVLEIVSAVAV